MIRYSEYREFPDDAETEVLSVIRIKLPAEITDYFLSLKYPDLLNIFALHLVREGKGVDVMKEVVDRKDSECRDLAIYAILYNVFCRDRNQGLCELPFYINEVTSSYFVRLFFNDFYHYRGRYLETIYENILSDIVSMCDLPNTYLKDNLGCLLVLIERGCDLLKVEQKRNLLTSLDASLLSSIFTFNAVGEPELRVIRARANLMLDLYSEDYQKTFENELASIEVRFEGWMIPAEAQHCCINRECVVLLSWIDLLGKIKVASELSEFILVGVYERLKHQIKLADYMDMPYKETLRVFMNRLDSKSPIFDKLVSCFIVDTDDLLYTLNVIDCFKTVEANHHDLLKERWRTESDTFWIKVDQKDLWPDDVKKMIQRLGLVPVYH